MTELKLRTILAAAVKIEEESYVLYTTAQEKANCESSKKFLNELAQEELQHKDKLLAIIENKRKLSELGFQKSKIQDLKIVDIMKGTTLSEDADYQRILVYAADREKITYEYYNSLAAGFRNTKVRVLFTKLAQEELIHKSKLEKEYDEYLLKEN